MIRWLTDRAEHARLTAELTALKARVGHGGASRRASEYILAALGSSRPPVPRPHFLPRRLEPQPDRGDTPQHAV